MKETLRRCTKCGFASDDLNLFVAEERYKHGRKNLCQRCSNERRAERTRRMRPEVRELLDREKSQPCADCGEQYPPYVMDFDHVRGEKKFPLSAAVALGCSFATIRRELEKCDVVCANCHRVRTYERGDIYRGAVDVAG